RCGRQAEGAEDEGHGKAAFAFGQVFYLRDGSDRVPCESLEGGFSVRGSMGRAAGEP
ncbi:MAG: hypothetical protein K0S81_3758, partial [Rhodospirillales bacterium]|nr:hypothetical protein [Rhodospirillales bacterium]